MDEPPLGYASRNRNARGHESKSNGGFLSTYDVVEQFDRMTCCPLLLRHKLEVKGKSIDGHRAATILLAVAIVPLHFANCSE